MEYIKRAEKTAESHSTEIRGPIESILREIAARGEAAMRDLALKFDRWEGDFLGQEETAGVD